MPTPLVLVELGSGSVIYTNAAAERFCYAYQESPAVEVYEGQERVGREALPHAVAARGQPFERRILEFRDAQGQSTWLQFHMHVLDGQPIAVLTFTDITELHEAQADLKEALVARDELVSMAAHELRSPIGAVGLAVEQICRKATSLDLHDVTRLTDLASRQVRRLTILISNLLDVTRLRAGRFELDREPASLRAVVEESVAPFVDQATAQQIPLSVEIETDAIGDWDVMRMDQVVTNLVTNAFKYGGGTPIRLRLEDGAPAAVRLIVENEGPPIPPGDQEQIFEPFRRASSRHKAHSLGLGLYIVREIVRAHGGSIQLESHPGRTRFTLTLPVTHGKTD